jgi:hypothetical protein
MVSPEALLAALLAACLAELLGACLAVYLAELLEVYLVGSPAESPAEQDLGSRSLGSCRLGHRRQEEDSGCCFDS